MPAVPPAARRAAAEPLHRRAQRAARTIAVLRQHYADADCALHHKSAWQLLVATILSAQCTDERVNMVTTTLFHKYRTLKSLAAADLGELEAAVRPTGFFRNKAHAIRETARLLGTEHGGKVPQDMEALTRLPGVGRKTAHVIRGTWFGLPAITVDTHVGRLSRRLGLTHRDDPVKVEQDLEAVLPAADRTFTSHALIWHGRQVCQARRPQCDRCTLAAFCPSAGQFPAT